MIEYLYLRICKPNGKARFLSIDVIEDKVLVATAYGTDFGFAVEQTKFYKYPIHKSWIVSAVLKNINFKKWPKFTPADYVPGKYMIGCDVDSWAVDYREVGQKRTHRFRGKGAFPTTEPFGDFLLYIHYLSPEQDWLDWLEDD